MIKESNEKRLSRIEEEIITIKKGIGHVGEWQLQGRAQLNILFSQFSTTFIACSISALGILVGGASLVVLVTEDLKLSFLLGCIMSIFGISAFITFLISAYLISKKEQKFLSEVKTLEQVSDVWKKVMEIETDG